MKPRIGITMGDVAGIGPEIILKSFNKDLYKNCNPLIIGDFETLNKLNQKLKNNNKIEEFNIIKVSSMSQIDNYQTNNFFPNIFVFDDFNLNLRNIKMGQVNALYGKASILFIEKVVKLIQNKILDGTVSAPTNKQSMNLAGYYFNGQTEYFANLTNTKEVYPLILIDDMVILQFTTHISMRDFLKSLTFEKVINVIRFADKSLKSIGYKDPKISIAGLNPHAGEHGLFGNEEIEIIYPAVDFLRKEGIKIFGPFPVDSLFIKLKDGEFDCIITLYHDQATIAMKLLGNPITLTLGLPFVRTSVGHGTAFDIAGKGKADASIFKQAIIKCSEFIRKKNNGLY